MDEFPLTPNQLIAFNLRSLRAEREWTQEEAAARISKFLPFDWHKANVSFAERSVDGKLIKRFSADEIVAICQAFDVPVIRLFSPSEHVIDGRGIVVRFTDRQKQKSSVSAFIKRFFPAGQTLG
jgi:hypothetical protein